VKDKIAALPPAEREHLAKLIEELTRRKNRELSQVKFLAFVQSVWPGFIYGRHHARIAQEFERVVNGECKRLIINLGPRHTKSEFASYLLPAWFLGRFPDKKIIQCSHTAELAVGFGRKVRNLVGSAAYQDIFPGVGLQTDSKAAGRWNTSAGGDYFAIGVGGAVTGKGADILIIDDPHAFTLDTLVPTTKGFKTIADIAIGDKVFGPDGKPTVVIAKSEVWEGRVVYEVTTDDNVTVECDSGHLWNYRSDTKLSAPYKNATTRELTRWAKSSKPCLPRHTAVRYPHKKLLVDPYVLGAWLGDGTTGLGRMTSHPDDMGFMRLQFEQGGYTTNALTDPYSFGVKKLRADLLAIGVRDNKHIPSMYLTASINQRMALLQGLMDTDGDVTEAGQCSFNNNNKLLVEQFQELIHSLGVKAKLHRYEDKRPNCNPVYRVTYKLKDCCRMPRKNNRTYTPTDKRCRSIAVKETPRRASMQCITVDRTDGLFLVTKAYIVTHNSEQEAAMAASNPEVYNKVYEWYTSGPRQRLQPGGAIIIVQCMTGDTRVLMSDAVEKPLKDIKVGDVVATYSNGELTSAKVLNHQSNGIDKVYKIRTTSGVIVRANERHPFLVEDKGVRKWIRLKNLKPGMLLVVMKDVIDHQDHSKRLVYADRAKLVKATIKETQMRRTESLNITASIKGYFVRLMGVMSPHTVMSYVNHIITKQTGHQERIDQPPKPITQTELKVGTVLLLKTLIKCLMNRVGDALYVKSFHQPTIQEHIGTVSYVLTVAMILVKSVRYCVTAAILLLGTQKQKEQLLQLQNTSVFTVEPIAEITYDGEEEVFDIQIEGTENFIANGVVSHNTRWSKRDLTGQVIEAAAQRGNENWRVVELPAVLPSGKPLWPEFWSIEELEATRDAIDVSKWQAQYQQNPTSEEGAIIKREWWQRWESETPPQTKFVLQTWDTAFEKSQRADYSACTTWGVFYKDDAVGAPQANIIMLDAKRGRYEFPELKQIVLDEYKYWEPDSIIIEKKASGAPLIYEMRAMGIPVGEFTPVRGNDKISRLNAVADLFASGRVWVPNTRWADDVVEEVAAFPAGQNDDYVDTVSMAMSRFRKGGFLTTNLDKPDEEPEFRGRSQRRTAYY
jgi:predicted phage terminase large subunit-like protein